MTRLTLLAIAWFVGLVLAAWRLPGYLPIPVILISLLILCFVGRCFKVAPLVLLLVAGVAALRLWLAEWRPAVDVWQARYNETVTVIGVIDDEPSTLTGQVAVRVLVEGVQTNDQWVYLDGQWLARTSGWPAGDPRGALCPWWPGLCYPAPQVQLRVNVDQLPFGQAAKLLRYGHRVRIDGKLTRAPVFDLFPYRETLARQGIYGLIKTQQIELLDTDQGWPVRRLALDWRAEAANRIDQLMPRQPKEAGLLKGILLGREGDLPDETTDALRRTSLTHIIVVSGYNIAILVVVMDWLLKSIRYLIAALADKIMQARIEWLARIFMFLLRRTLVTSLFALLVMWFILGFYAFFVGLGASAVRATLMGIAFALTIFAGRPYNALNSLVMTAWGMTIVDPWVLLDIGFQLSFSATLGLIVVQPVLSRVMARWTVLSERRMLRGMISTTLAATLMTAPIISYYFGQVSIIGLLANILVLPVQPPIMFLGGAAVVSGEIAHQIDSISLALGGSLFGLVLPLRDWFLWFGRQFATLAWVPLAWSSLVAERLSLAPWSAVDTRASLAVVGGFYLVLGYGAYWLAVKVKLAPRFTRPELAPSPQPMPSHAPTPSPKPRPATPPPFAPQPTVAFAERAGRPVWRRHRRPVRQASDALPADPTSGPPTGGIATLPLQAMTRDTPSSMDLTSDNTLPAPCWVATLLQPGRAALVAGVVLLGWLGVGIVSARSDGLLHVTVLSSGETVVVQTPRGWRLVIGGGAWPSEIQAALDQGRLPLDRHVDVIAATRTDRQSLENLTPLFERYSVAHALAPPRPSTSAGYAWNKAVEDRPQASQNLASANSLAFIGGVTFETLVEDKVQNARLYSLSWGEVRFVLAGGLRNPTQTPRIPAEVILVSPQIHNNLLEDLLQKTSPTVVIVQSAIDEADELPRTLAASQTVYITNDVGQITLTTDGQRLWVETER